MWSGRRASQVSDDVGPRHGHLFSSAHVLDGDDVLLSLVLAGQDDDPIAALRRVLELLPRLVGIGIQIHA
jgi:hypothetical protein